MSKLIIVHIESLDNRYTKQWRDAIPEMFSKTGMTIVNVDGDASGYDKPQSGAFFDFTATCLYKSSQASTLSRMISEGDIESGDIVFFTDAWNPTVHFLKYMLELQKITNVKLMGIWHAGAYDPTDILGYTIQNRAWVKALEQSMFYAYDFNFFGTKQHQDKFHKNLNLEVFNSYVVGYPLDYLQEVKKYESSKEDIVVFPHRLNDDKAPWFFEMLEQVVHMTRPDIKFSFTQKLNLSKEEYYKYLGKCKVIFSANKHENLGIGTFEAMILGCVPLVPNKLSYKEMYDESFKYDCPDALYENPKLWVGSLASRIISEIDNYSVTVTGQIYKENVKSIFENFFSGSKLVEIITKENDNGKE